jgi:hypothetical protein
VLWFMSEHCFACRAINMPDVQIACHDGFPCFDWLWDVPRTVSYVKQRAFNVVVLQFPDELLQSARAVHHRLLEALSEAKVEAQVTAAVSRPCSFPEPPEYLFRR